MRIAILYIGTGRYSIFWNDFYKSCENFFIKNAKKHYFFFTDSKNFKSDDNITIVPQESLGWPLIACHRYKILKKIKEEIKDYDYVFFFNGNMEFIRPISEEEFLPTEQDGNIVAPLHSCNKRTKNNQDFQYERNPKSTAYIPFGEGKYYFHSGILGGKPQEFIELLDECEKMMDEDLANNIIPKVHDESTFNRYILNKNYKLLDNYYIYPVHGKLFATLNPKVKIIQRDKSKFKYGGHSYLRGESDTKLNLFNFLFRKKDNA